MEKFELSRRELVLLNFYGGIDNVIWHIENETNKTETNKIGDWKQILHNQKDQLKLIKSLEQRAIKFLNYENKEKNNVSTL